jgi:hypothetical protein
MNTAMIFLILIGAQQTSSANFLASARSPEQVIGLAASPGGCTVCCAGGDRPGLYRAGLPHEGLAILVDHAAGWSFR